ncbi:MAG: two-component sensor histidine kinase [Actinomycetia bacterium]|nr:two-component sensor histidine kinase [Actinomycetes bacterium]
MLEALVGVLWAVGIGLVLTRRRESPGSRFARVVVALSTGGAIAASIAARDSLPTVVILVAVPILFIAGLIVFQARYRGAPVVDRTRLQWVAWGVVVFLALSSAAWLVDSLLGWPEHIGAVAVGLSLVVPLALVLGSFESFAGRVDRLLVGSIEAGGILVMIGIVYLLVVLGFGDAPDHAQRRVLGLSMIAAAIAALAYTPVRSRLAEFANRRVYGGQRAPDEALQTFGARMSRAIALDELLLQLAESLHRSLRLKSAEVWTGTDGSLERAAAIPDRGPRRVRLTAEELPVVARSHVSGNAWMQVWLPGILAEYENRVVRVAPMAHSGELLGLLVCAREEGDAAFTEEEERVLTELARQVGLALHNSRLDTALQASLDDLRVANDELSASRARIVAAADHSRRRIERDLHDGAQQHLVALAVKLGLARQMLEADPAVVATLLEELRADAQTTLTELRELAHGIYPPLLMDRGLPEALRAAANRAVLPAEVVADVGRYDSDVEAAVYFCCLEAMQNAGKHAGEGSRLTVTVKGADDELCFEVADDGAGFDATNARGGHGFVNMADRLGAIGGSLEVDSAPGHGTRIRGHIKQPARAAV